MTIEDCMRLADRIVDREVGDPHGNGYSSAGLKDQLRAAIVSYGDAQWNAAIEAVVTDQYGGGDCPAVRRIRGLKQ